MRPFKTGLNDLSRTAESGLSAERIFAEWAELISRSNKALMDMSENFGEKMGTTLSALLIINGEYYVVQVGDTRVYLCSDNTITRITADHSYVMEQMSRGLMTETEARLSRKRNVLTRCIGVVKDVRGDFYNGSVRAADIFLISSDGFHGGASDGEIYTVLEGLNIHKRREAQRRINKYIGRRKRNGEKDNITALVVLVG